MNRLEFVITHSAIITEQSDEVFKNELREAPLYSLYSVFEH